jgi:hypothetical protein
MKLAGRCRSLEVSFDLAECSLHVLAKAGTTREAHRQPFVALPPGKVKLHEEERQTYSHRCIKST